MKFQPFDFNDDIVANHGGLTLARGGVYQYGSAHLYLMPCMNAKSCDMKECDAPVSNKIEAGIELM